MSNTFIHHNMQRCAFARISIRFLISGITYVGTSESLSVMWKHFKSTPSVSTPSEPKRPKHHHYGGSLYCIFSVGLSLALDLFVRFFVSRLDVTPKPHTIHFVVTSMYHQKKKYIDCTVATLKPCTIPNWYQLSFLAAVLCHLFWPTRVPSFTSRLDTLCSNQPCQAFCGPWESRCSNCGSKIPSSGPFIWDVSMLQHVYVTLQKPCSLLSYYKLLGIHTPGQTNKNQKNGPWSWKPQNPLLRFHINWTRMFRLDNLWWSNPKENIENGDPKNMKIPC